MPSGSSLAGAVATGADVAASLMRCIAGACPGTKNTDWVLRHNTAPIRAVAKMAAVLSIGIEAHEFNQARLNGNGLGMLDATVDTGAMLPAFFGGVPGVVFSTSYAVTDNAHNWTGTLPLFITSAIIMKVVQKAARRDGPPTGIADK